MYWKVAIAKVFFRSLLLVSLLLVFSSDIAFATKLHRVHVEQGSGIEVTMMSYYDVTPRYGYHPLRVTIKNNTKKDRDWLLLATSSWDYGWRNTYRFTKELAVKGQSTQTFDVFVPIAFSKRDNADRPRTKIELFGHGIKGRKIVLESVGRSGHLKELSRYTLLGEELSIELKGKITNQLQSKHRIAFNGATFGAKSLPVDWRGYLGVESVWMTSREWGYLKPGPRSAIREWTATGGDLHVCQELYQKDVGESVKETFPGARWKYDSGKPLPNTYRLFSKHGKYGLGTIDVHQRCTERDIAPAIKSTKAWPFEKAVHSYQNTWSLTNRHLVVEQPRGFLVFVMFIYGIIVGPVNILMFAGRKVRHRLFWTTPLIAGVTTFLLLLLIVLQEGVSGVGYRNVAVYLMPQETKEVISQEQISRTGLLLSSSFSSEERPFIATLQTRSLGSRQRQNISRTYRYDYEDKRYEGDWFTNRRTEAHFLRTTRFSRARVEVLEDNDWRRWRGRPEIISSIDADLSYLFLSDEAGRYWKARNIKKGQKVTLSASTKREFHRFKDRVTKNFGPLIRDTLPQEQKFQPYFMAEAASSGNAAIETLKSIKWKKQKTVYHGAVKLIGSEGV